MTQTNFTLDPQLVADTYVLGTLPLSRVLMMNEVRYPWLILVPERAGISEIIELSDADQQQLMREISIASRALQSLFQPDKLNVGALGNRVRQLHVHVMGRFVSDAAWPGPVWGHSPAVPYPPHQAGITIDRLLAALAPQGLQPENNA
jgi:diadenosine tetraphosphate (Ap4A) HIT family hydrolase